MARKRMIDPNIWQDENFGKLSHLARLLFIGLFSNADDEGRIRANDTYLRSTIFMYDDIKLTDVRQAVDEVSTKMKTVELYEIDGNRYVQLLKWDEYQKQREERIQKSLIPKPVRQVTDKCQTDDGPSSLSRLSRLSRLSSRLPPTSGGRGLEILRKKVQSLKKP